MVGAKKGRRFRWLVPLVLALAAFAAARLSFFESLELRLLDFRFKVRGPRSVSHSPFRLVALDDQSSNLLRIKPPYPRSYYAHLIENLNRAGARLIVLDIAFTEVDAQHPEQDSLLALAVAKAGNVILTGSISYDFSAYLTTPYAYTLDPIDALKATGAHWGFSNALQDGDDFYRRYLLYQPVGSKMQHLLGLEVLRALLRLPDTLQVQTQNGTCYFGPLRLPLYDRQTMLINYYGPTETFPFLKFHSVLDDSSWDLGENDSNYMERFFQNPAERIENGVIQPFAGKVILVGATQDILKDNVNTPFFDYGKTPRKMPGVEMHAHALQTILDRAFIKRIPGLFLFVLVLIFTLALYYLVAWLKSWQGVILTILLTAGVLLVSLVAFSTWNYWLDLMAFLLAAILAYLGTSLYHYFQERREKAFIRNLFAHYLPEPVVQDLIEHPELLKLGGERRVVTILFADIIGFTTISEQIAPEPLVALLNEFFTAMTEVILSQGGIIDKYEGDLIMAEFGTPIAHSDHAQRACRATLRMQDKLRELRPKWTEQGKPALSIRIGLNTGEVIAGNMGSQEVFDYTVVGDAVNLCARLEEANKFYGTQILISQTTAQALPAAFVTRPLDDLRVRGRSGSVRIFELMAEDSSALSCERQEALAAYSQGWDSYQNQAWTKARIHFESVLRLTPNDQPVLLLLERCQQFEKQPPDPSWDGVTVISER